MERVVLSTRVIKSLESASVELSALINMSADDILAIKGIGPKALVEIQQWITDNQEPVVELKEESTEPQFTVSSIELIREKILSNKECEKVFNSDKADRDVEEVTKLFLNREIDYASLAHSLNTLHADDEHLAVMVGKLSSKVKLSVDKKWTNFHFEKMKAILASLLLHGLIDTNQIESEVKTDKEINEDTGKVEWFKRTYITMGEEKTKDALYGIHQEPGVVLQRSTKVKVGGKSQKLSSMEKIYLKRISSMPLKLAKTSREVMKQYLTQTKWYKQSESGKSNEDPILLKNRVEVLLDNIEKAQSMSIIYLSAWLDYRTRTYYDFTLEGINPHGKTFQTSQWELAVPLTITDEAIHHYYYSAVCIIDGRTTHDAATRKFLANKDHYLSELRKTKMRKCEVTGKEFEDMDKNFYNSRLADAIEDYYNGTPSAFLLSEDATNGGMQHGGTGFRCKPMMEASNVGGLNSQQDSHGVLQEKLGLKTRDEAKDIHQPLLHGATMKSIAKSMKVTESEAKSMMIKAYGPEVMNIPNIADWGSKAIDNNNTSLFWKTMDGFKAQSIAYIKSVPLTIYAPSGVNKCGYSTIKISKDMPMYKDRKGNAVYGARFILDKDNNRVVDSDGKPKVDKSYGGETKLRGLYANITHSNDGSVLRGCVVALSAEKASGLFKHDNILCHGNFMTTIRESYRSGVIRAFHFSVYDSAIEQIVENFKGIKPMKIDLKKGEGTVEMIEKSEYFLSA